MSDEVQAIIFVLYFGFVIFVGMFASGRMNRSFRTWAMLSLLISPVIALVFLLVLGPQAPSGEEMKSGPP